MFLENCCFVVWLSLPLLMANMIPVLVGRFGAPIDGGRRWRDGQPIFGPGKTWIGFIGGFSLAILWTFLLVIIMLSVENTQLADAWGDQFAWSVVHISTLALGALLGDLAASFLKRRLKKPSGSAWPIIDQFDAVVGGFGLTALVDWPWFSQTFVTRWSAVLALCLVYYLGHALLSRVSFELGLKSHPN